MNLEVLEQSVPVVTQLKALQEVLWQNPGRLPTAEALENSPLTMTQLQDASDRLDRFASYFKSAFPETVPDGGLLESPLRQIPAMKACLEKTYGVAIGGELLLKLDSHLPVSGSIKARGGIYEVLCLAEKIALEAGFLQMGGDYAVLDTDAARKLFSEFSIAVGSTGNLGLSIGMIGAKLGFRVTVHMSADARQWKKDLLRSKGVTVMEYPTDYSVAVANGRAQARLDPKCYFVDDENSETLFLGYSVAALRLKKQLEAMQIPVDAAHPLQVYLPCGVGGGPGGVAFGLKQVFGDGVRCWFAEPTHSPCMLLGMATGLHNAISVQDIGVDNRTAADGLAVGRASGFVGRVMEPLLHGCYTVSDERMYALLAQLTDTEGIRLEPSALAGMYGPVLLPEAATHIVWATGGSMVPEEELEKYYQIGQKYL